MEYLETEKALKNAAKFECVDCIFRCSKQSDWTRHINTRKHIAETKRKQDGNEFSAKVYSCANCSKIYQTRPGLWKHAQKCLDVAPTKNPGSPSSVDPELISKIVAEVHRHLGVSDLLKNSQEMVKNSQELVKIAKESEVAVRTVHHTTNNTTNNAQFNVQFFLNEKCKDAINFTDFVNSITLNQEDLQTVVKHGHIEGNSKIIADMLEKLGVYRRPIHCMDPKRDTVYIRENDEWEKEEQELPRIKRLANVVSHKVIQQSNVWHEQNPDFMQNEEKKDESLHIMSQVFGTDNALTDEKKIIKNVIHQVEVDKIPEKRVMKKNMKRL